MEIFVVEVYDPSSQNLIHYEPFISEKDAQLAMDRAVGIMKEVPGAEVSWITEGKVQWPIGARIAFPSEANLTPVEYRICRRELVESTEG